MAETIRVAAEQNTLEVNAGEAVDTVITVQNLSAAVGVFTIDLEGLDAAWYSLSSNSVSLFPGDSTTTTLVIVPPRTSTSLAKDYPFTIRVSSQRDEEDVETLPFTLKMNAFYDFLLDYQPQRARGASAVHTLTLSNTGNAKLAFGMEGRDTDGLCSFEFEPEAPAVAPGETIEVAVTAKGKRPLRGMPALYQYEITATPSDGEMDAKSSFAQLEVPPRIPGWTVRVVTLSVIAVIIGVGVYLALNRFLWAPIEVAELNVAPLRVALTEGESSQLSAVAKDGDGNRLPDQPVAWTTSDPSVAFVSATGGQVRAIAPGTVVITATLVDQEFEPRSATVTVLPTVVSTDCVRYDPASVRFGVSGDSRLVITDGINDILTLSVGDDQVNAMTLVSRHNGRCFIGRDAPASEREASEIEFWIGSSGVEGGEISPEDCEAYNASNTQIRSTSTGDWILTDGSTLLIRMDSQEDAQAALQLASRQSSRCFVSRSFVEGSQAGYLTQYWE
ncbi:MAG: Ig-like domain-containing protein [Chloroflexi bacterium]|nr:Ig-like domain-containing protein [Chloroflexota bacterium]